MGKWVTALFTKWSKNHLAAGWDVSSLQLPRVFAGTNMESNVI